MKKKNTTYIGCKALDFTLEDQENKAFTLADFKGRKVLLSFHPLAWTSVCAKQMKSLEGNKKNFTKVNTIAVGISVDSTPCKKAWAKSLGVTKTRFLSDFWPHGAIAQQYGVFREKEGISGRANIIIDEEQTISFMKNYPLSQVPNIQEILKVLTPPQITKKSTHRSQR